jgi:hypothetical protein
LVIRLTLDGSISNFVGERERRLLTTLIGFALHRARLATLGSINAE